MVEAGQCLVAGSLCLRYLRHVLGDKRGHRQGNRRKRELACGYWDLAGCAVLMTTEKVSALNIRAQLPRDRDRTGTGVVILGTFSICHPPQLLLVSVL